MPFDLNIPNTILSVKNQLLKTKKVIFTEYPVWIIDPIDGTTNFVHKLPHCSISIGFYVGKQAQIGIVYNPITDELFSAIKGQGALLNGRGIKHSGEKNLNKSQIITEFGSQRDSSELDAKVKNMRTLVEKSHSIRCLGGAALNACYVANGSADVYYEYGIHVWDISACFLICSEAGCFVSNPNGDGLNILNRSFLVTSTKELADQVIPLLENVPYESD
jgi:myo-inositol-1(or 4)-monophosphatase